ARHTAAHALSYDGGERTEEKSQSDLLRCIFGSLAFRVITPDGAWVTWNAGTVVKLAQAIYDDRALRPPADPGRRPGRRRLHQCRHPGALSRAGTARSRLLGS